MVQTLYNKVNDFIWESNENYHKVYNFIKDYIGLMPDCTPDDLPDILHEMQEDWDGDAKFEFSLIIEHCKIK